MNQGNISWDSLDTDQIQMEEKIPLQNECLDNVLESLTHPFYVIDANDYTIKIANSFVHSGTLSESTTCYELCHKKDKPCDAAKHSCPIEMIKKIKKPVTVKHVHCYKDGDEKNVEVHGYPIFDNEGNIAQIFVYYLDITERKRVEEELKKSLEKSRRNLRNTIHTIATIVEIRDPFTAYHQQIVAKLSCAIAQEMGLSKNQIDGLNMSGILHDIGKIKIPVEILIKPGPLTDFEFKKIKDHPQAGYDILKHIEFPWPVSQTVLQHHERLDGSGYPSGLCGNSILLETKILSVADVVAAISSHRPYRPASGISKALYEVSKRKDILYDPDVVDACLCLFTKKGFRLD